MSRADAGARAEFLEALTSLAAASTPRVVEEKTVVSFAPPAAADATSLHIDVTIAADAITVALAPWQHRVDLGRDDDDDDDAMALQLDLVAAALFGRARLRTWTRDGTLLGYELAWLRDDTFVRFAGARRWHWPWPTPQVTTARNAATPPPGLRLTAGGRLPWAPWAGTLATAAVEPAAAALPVDGELDLHNFHPREVDPLVRAYIDECLARGILRLRIVHGKGIGALRRTVTAILERHPAVAHHRLGGHGEGSWGATLVTLRPDHRERA